MKIQLHLSKVIRRLEKKLRIIMFSHLIKQNILSLVVKAREGAHASKEDYIPLGNIITKHIKNLEEFENSLFYLISDGYIEQHEDSLRLTNKGEAAYRSRYFINEFQKKSGIFVRDFVLLACNVVVAITAIKALNASTTTEKKEIQALTKRLDSISLPQYKETIKREAQFYLKLAHTDTINIKVSK